MSDAEVKLTEAISKLASVVNNLMDKVLLIAVEVKGMKAEIKGRG